MALPVKTALVALKKLGPIVGPEAVALAKKLLGKRNLKRAAHDLAWQRGGRVGEVTFTDGARRWVAVGADDKPIAAFPPYGSGSDEELSQGLRNVDFSRCMAPPDRELKEEAQRHKAEKKLRKIKEKAQLPK